ncbi:MAG: hypothetical protein B6241_13325 [Spirochaetaceae bacterium 4572_59]|nr:MAG: hypothetical protein B6241_13325 [Spirochaetaceae bacterium 4572_59]
MKKFLLAGLMILTTCTLLIAGGRKEQNEAENPGRSVKVAVLNGPSGVGMIQLMENPPMQDKNIRVETIAVSAPKVLLGQLIKEEWDFAALPASMAAILYNKGLPYKMAAVTGLGNLYLIADKSYGELSMKDLQDKKIYIPGKNTTPDLIMQLLCDKNKVDIGYDYSFNPNDLAKALIAKIADIAVLPEPMASLALSKNPNLMVAADLQNLWEESYPDKSLFPITVMVVNAAFEENNPILTREIMMASEDSINWVCENPADASVLIGKHGFMLPPAVVEKSIPRSNFSFLTAEEAMASADPYYTEVYRINPASIGGKIPDEGFYLK